MLEFNQYMKSDKMQYIIYADIDTLIKKIDGCANNPEILQQQKQVSILFHAEIQSQQFGHLIT